MSSRIFVDSVFVIALISPRDQHHRQALRLSRMLDGQPVLITTAVLFEIGNALARTHKREAVRAIERFLAAGEVEIVHPTPELFAQALALFKAYEDKAWSLTDCLSFVVMREAGAEAALTFDRHFEQAGFQVLMRDDPGARSARVFGLVGAGTGTRPYTGQRARRTRKGGVILHEVQPRDDRGMLRRGVAGSNVGAGGTGWRGCPIPAKVT